MELFKKQYRGRGIRFMFLVSPQLSERDLSFFKEIGRVGAASKYFSGVDVNVFENGGGVTWIKIYCPDANFNVKLSEAKKMYTDIFYGIFGDVAKVCFGLLHKNFNVTEYSFLYRLEPKERPGEFVPLVTLETVGAFIFWGRMYAKNLNEDITKQISDKNDKIKLKGMMKEFADARPMVAENKDFILRMAKELDIWKPYKTLRDVSPSTLNKTELIALKDVSQKNRAIMHYHWMPLDEAELKLINDYINTL